MNTINCPLEKGVFYHIYNRGINSCTIFFNHDNYNFFLRRYSEYLSPYVDTYAMCLLPNHFHLLIRVKEKFPASAVPVPPDVPHFDQSDLTGFQNLSGLIIPKRCIVSQAFSNFFNSYSKTINKQQNRHGSLFEKPFRRKAITDSNYFTNVVFYIHANPQLHGIINDFRLYPWSSYNKILKNTPTRLQREQVLEWFASTENFEAYHNQKMEIETLKEILLE